jgi:hypothetical protein
MWPQKFQRFLYYLAHGCGVGEPEGEEQSAHHNHCLKHTHTTFLVRSFSMEKNNIAVKI